MVLDQVWKLAVQFHGCACPALAIGARATAHVLEYFQLDAQDHQVVCTAESFSCAIDAVQAVLGCTIGNGRLRVTHNHKMAFRFCDGNTNQSLYLTLRERQQPCQGLTDKILRMPIGQLFVIEELEEVPNKPPNSVLSAQCAMRSPGAATRAIPKSSPRASSKPFPHGYDRDW